jgi:hypothetical protein
MVNLKERGDTTQHLHGDTQEPDEIISTMAIWLRGDTA